MLPPKRNGQLFDLATARARPYPQRPARAAGSWLSARARIVATAASATTQAVKHAPHRRAVGQSAGEQDHRSRKRAGLTWKANRRCGGRRMLSATRVMILNCGNFMP